MLWYIARAHRQLTTKKCRFPLQELLWEAGKAGAEGGDVGVLSPETAAVKRASALESGRFLDSIAEAEAEARRSRLFEEGNGGDSSPGDDESDAAAPVRSVLRAKYEVSIFWTA